MVGNLVLRGMLVGVLAGLLTFGFARIFGEPQVDRAIAFEEQMNQAKGEVPEPELVSRETQAGLGLFTGVIVYGAAVGGLFSLVFAFVHGRVGRLGPRATAALLAWVASLRSYSSPTSNIRQIRLQSEIPRRSGFERNYSL
jgi:Probable cobalt transporter subunit (CbtA)